MTSEYTEQPEDQLLSEIAGVLATDDNRHAVDQYAAIEKRVQTDINHHVDQGNRAFVPLIGMAEGIRESIQTFRELGPESGAGDQLRHEVRELMVALTAAHRSADRASHAQASRDEVPRVYVSSLGSADRNRMRQATLRRQTTAYFEEYRKLGATREYDAARRAGAGEDDLRNIEIRRTRGALQIAEYLQSAGGGMDDKLLELRSTLDRLETHFLSRKRDHDEMMSMFSGMKVGRKPVRSNLVTMPHSAITTRSRSKSAGHLLMPKRHVDFPSRPWVTSPPTTTGGGSTRPRRESWAPTPSGLRAPAPTDVKPDPTQEERIAEYKSVEQRWEQGKASPKVLIDTAARVDYPTENKLDDDALEQYTILIDKITSDPDNWLHTTNAGQLLLRISTDTVDEEKGLTILRQLWKASQQLKGDDEDSVDLASDSILDIVEFHHGKLADKTGEVSWRVGGKFYAFVRDSIAPIGRNRKDLASGGHGATPTGEKDFPITEVYQTRFGSPLAPSSRVFTTIKRILEARTLATHGMQYTADKVIMKRKEVELLPDSVMKQYGEVLGIDPESSEAEQWRKLFKYNQGSVDVRKSAQNILNMLDAGVVSKEFRKDRAPLLAYVKRGIQDHDKFAAHLAKIQAYMPDKRLYRYIVYHQLKPEMGRGMSLDYPLEYLGRGHRTIEEGGTVIIRDPKWKKSGDEPTVSRNITDLHLFSELFGQTNAQAIEVRRNKLIHRRMESKNEKKPEAEGIIRAYIKTIRSATENAGLHQAELFDSWVMSKFTGQRAIDMRAEMAPAVYYSPSKPTEQKQKKKKAPRVGRINAAAAAPEVTVSRRLDYWYKPANRYKDRPPHDSAGHMYKGAVPAKMNMVLHDSRLLLVNPTDPSQGLIGDEDHPADEFSSQIEHRLLNGYLAIDGGSERMLGDRMTARHYAVHKGSKTLHGIPHGPKRKGLVILANQQSQGKSDHPHIHRIAGFLQVLYGMDTVNKQGPDHLAKWGQENGFNKYLPLNVQNAAGPFITARRAGVSNAFKTLFTDKYLKDYEDFHEEVADLARTRDLSGLKDDSASKAVHWVMAKPRDGSPHGQTKYFIKAFQEEILKILRELPLKPPPKQSEEKTAEKTAESEESEGSFFLDDSPEPTPERLRELRLRLRKSTPLRKSTGPKAPRKQLVRRKPRPHIPDSYYEPDPEREQKLMEEGPLEIDEHGQIIPWFSTRFDVHADVPVDASRHVHPQFAQSRAGFQPVYGHVSLVKPGVDATADHFMFGLEKEMDDNQMLMVQESRKGPFKNETGRSRILHSTANTTYRRRGSNMEITITRKATLPEIQILIAKLNAHSMTNGSTSFLTLLLRGKSYRMGPLAGVNLDLLRKQILEGIQKHGSAGLVVTDVRSGPLTEFLVHSYNFASEVMRDKSMFAV